LQGVADLVSASWHIPAPRVTASTYDGTAYISNRHLTPLLPDTSGDTLGDRIHSAAYQTPAPGYTLQED
jgi:hypothetical protein